MICFHKAGPVMFVYLSLVCKLIHVNWNAHVWTAKETKDERSMVMLGLNRTKWTFSLTIHYWHKALRSFFPCISYSWIKGAKTKLTNRYTDNHRNKEKLAALWIDFNKIKAFILTKTTNFNQPATEKPWMVSKLLCLCHLFSIPWVCFSRETVSSCCRQVLLTGDHLEIIWFLGVSI